MHDKNELLKLNPSERLKVIEELWNSLEGENIPGYNELSTEQEAEILKRIERIKVGESKLHTWDEVKADARKKE
jgi:putative addiction module component (TIGR02574 family)